MFVYEKKLQYPVNIKQTNPKLAKIIITQYGGPDGELGASLRYLSQRFTMPLPELKGTLTDIGTEELGHLEMIGAIVYQLTKNLSEEEIKKAGLRITLLTIRQVFIRKVLQAHRLLPLICRAKVTQSPIYTKTLQQSKRQEQPMIIY